MDGSVDVSDFNNWNAAKFNSTLSWDDGDFNGDGSVDVSDFNAWNSNKFQSSDGGSTVPEPTAWGIMLLAAALAWGREQRRSVVQDDTPRIQTDF